MLQGVKAEYMSFAVSGVNNVVLPDEWWDRAAIRFREKIDRDSFVGPFVEL